MKNPMTMGRTEIIDALRAYTTHTQLAHMIMLPTADLRSHLAYHLSHSADKMDGRACYTQHRELVRLPEPKQVHSVFIIEQHCHKKGRILGL